MKEPINRRPPHRNAPVLLMAFALFVSVGAVLAILPVASRNVGFLTVEYWWGLGGLGVLSLVIAATLGIWGLRVVARIAMHQDHVPLVPEAKQQPVNNVDQLRANAAIQLTAFALLLCLGAVLAIIPVALRNVDFTTAAYWSGSGAFGVGLLLLAAIMGFHGRRSLAKFPPPEEPKRRNQILYYRHVVGIGYVLLLATVVGGTFLCGLLYTGQVGLTAEGFNEQFDSESGPAALALLLVVSCAAAMVGALFFVANSLHRKRKFDTEPFSTEKFWAGLWFRLGEAVLFSLVFFWLSWKSGNAQADSYLDYTWLPIVSLLLGMFVTSGEVLVFAIALALFRAVRGFFPREKEEDSSTKENEDSPSDENQDPSASGRKEPKAQVAVVPTPTGSDGAASSSATVTTVTTVHEEGTESRL